MRRKQRANPISSKAKRKVRAMRSDFNAWQKDMRGTMNDIGEATREARHAMGGAIERFESWGEDNLPRVADAVRSRPFKACAVSLGAGALIGALLLR